VLAWGYRYGEVQLDILKDIRRMTVKANEGHTVVRRPQQVSLGCHLLGAKQPHPDPNHTPTIAGGIAKRLGANPPEPELEIRLRFKKFVKTWLMNNLPKLPDDTDYSFENWITNTPYTQERKKELQNLWTDIIDPKDPDFSKVKAFIKDETYPSYKYPRNICSRTDAFKCLYGPIVKQVENILFKLPNFLKKVPAEHKVQHILDHIGDADGHVHVGDATSWECHFKKWLREAAENQLMYHCLENAPEEIRNNFRWCVRQINGEQKITFKNVRVVLETLRMSGEMDTSLGNGFTTLMMIEFLCDYYNIEKCGTIFVEGDDNLAALRGTLTKEMFSKLGFMIKVEHPDSLSEASFCGLVFDVSEKIMISNPNKYLMEFGWADKKYIGSSRKRMLELLRAKSLSLKHQHHGAPILDALARYGLRCTKGITVREHWVRKHYGTYRSEEVLHAMKNAKLEKLDPGPMTRALCEKLFGITVAAQIQIERYLDSLTDIIPLDIDLGCLNVSPDCIHFSDSYVKHANVRDRDELIHPSLPVDDRTTTNFDYLKNHSEETIRNAFAEVDKAIYP
jgi:hypothetical protein